MTGKVFSSEHAFPSKFRIYLEHCPRGEAVIRAYRPSAPFLYEVASLVKKLPFRPLGLLLLMTFSSQRVHENWVHKGVHISLGYGPGPGAAVGSFFAGVIVFVFIGLDRFSSVRVVGADIE